MPKIDRGVEEKLIYREEKVKQKIMKEKYAINLT
jgi:hypothetical protein